MDMIFKHIDGRIFRFEKFNPYHDRLGRFTSPNGGGIMTFSANEKTRAGQLAIEREKKRQAAAANAYMESKKNPGSSYGLSREQYDDLMNSGPVSFWTKAKQYGMDKETANKFKEENKLVERAKERANQREAEKREAERKQNAELDERIKQELPGLNQETIRRANDASMFDHGSVAARDALRRVDAYRERNPIKDDWNDEQKAYAQQREEEYKQLIAEYYNDSNARFANNPSWAITGRANYNVKRSDKLNRAADNKAAEYEEKIKRFEENTRKGIESRAGEDAQIARWRQGKWKYGETVSADDPLAEKKLQAKLDYLNEQQNSMKAANAYYRKNGTMQGFTGYSEKTNASIDAQMKEIASRGYGSANQPFASYSLSNNNAQIKATQSRLSQIQSQKAKATEQKASGSGGATGQTFAGGKVVRNAEANRLQIVFDGKPSADVRAQLKANGFKWAPSQGAWQRQMTDNAESALRRMIDSENK